MIKLSDRLQRVYDMVPACSCLADVGCDHGYLTIALLQSDKVDRAIAMDVNPGPLSVARENIKKAGLLDKSQLVLSDGLAGLERGQAQVICICGMGGLLMEKILSAGLDQAKDCQRLILEPQSEYRTFRGFLMNQGFVIDDEDLVMEENKIYPIMAVHYESDVKKRVLYSQAELTYGPVILKKRPALLDILLEKNKNEYGRILASLKKQDFIEDSPGAARMGQLSEELELIEQIQKKVTEI